MATQLPSSVFRRVQIPPSISITRKPQHVRHATLLARPHRPYTLTQLITLSDGSTYTARTTSPKPLFKSTKDTRNHPLWQPSLDSLRNVEQDEAGRLRAFRERFGRGWDLDSQEGDEGRNENKEMNGMSKKEGSMEEESLMDLISGAGGVSVQTSGIAAAKGKGGKAEDGSKGKVEMVKVMKDGVLVNVPAQSRSERRK